MFNMLIHAEQFLNTHSALGSAQEPQGTVGSLKGSWLESTVCSEHAAANRKPTSIHAATGHHLCELVPSGVPSGAAVLVMSDVHINTRDVNGRLFFRLPKTNISK